ncbi:histidine phosphatase family protein [Facklamia miroungae]|uniref:2,3-bisphosphoglycerate-dependent phosphoglycerate mutase n=1 Tax=Facklamia miroungae TaxID=120956 RepID=A0A1G7U175_9LACT|nr:histidine phosphatase family protein [Facklamia miroungae]NKZ29865.1 histidine phosphatase family protein [Facklamia miroungae]SDG41286.1 2,3-bisphosphoglycerate-dependent phosphoglycerate mutase [Facklamia miroungae]
MRRIYLVRHSIRDLTVKNEQAPLTVEGKKLAEELANFFEDKEISAIYASPYLRVKQTIEPTAERLNLKIIYQKDLRERRIGEWVEDFQTFAQNQWDNFNYKLPNGESLNEVSHRVLSCFEEIAELSQGNIIIASHGTALSVLMNALTKKQFSYQDFLSMKQPQVYELKYSKRQVEEWKKIQIH